MRQYNDMPSHFRYHLLVTDNEDGSLEHTSELSSDIMEENSSDHDANRSQSNDDDIPPNYDLDEDEMEESNHMLHSVSNCLHA